MWETEVKERWVSEELGDVRPKVRGRYQERFQQSVEERFGLSQNFRVRGTTDKTSV